MANGRLLINVYYSASILKEVKTGTVLTDLYRKTKIDYAILREIVDKLEGQGYIKTKKNERERGKPRIVVRIDTKIKQKAMEFLDTYNNFLNLLED